MMLRSVRTFAVAALASALAARLVAQNPPGQNPPPPGQNPPSAGQAAPQPPLPPNGWRVDPVHSAITFRVRHLGITWVNGKFGQWHADLIYDPGNPEAATVTTRIQTASVTTENDRRDGDIRANYLVADSFPEITFTTRRVERVDATHLRITGDLTIHGVTRPVVLETEFNGVLSGQRGRRVSFTATTTVSRREFGVLRNPLVEGVPIVGDEVRITIDIEAVQPVAS